MFPAGGVNLTVWAEPKATDVTRGLSVSLREFWIKCWGWCCLVLCTDFVPVQRGSWALPHLTHCWTSVIFFYCCFHPLYCRLAPQALRRCMLWHYTISNYQLWNIFRCLWLPGPIQSSTFLQAHGKDKTAPHSKRIPHCAGNRRVPHCPAAPSRFLFFAMQSRMEMN